MGRKNSLPSKTIGFKLVTDDTDASKDGKRRNPNPLDKEVYEVLCKLPSSTNICEFVKKAIISYGGGAVISDISPDNTNASLDIILNKISSLETLIKSNAVVTEPSESIFPESKPHQESNERKEEQAVNLGDTDTTKSLTSEEEKIDSWLIDF